MRKPISELYRTLLINSKFRIFSKMFFRITECSIFAHFLNFVIHFAYPSVRHSTRTKVTISHTLSISYSVPSKITTSFLFSSLVSQHAFTSPSSFPIVSSFSFASTSHPPVQLAMPQSSLSNPPITPHLSSPYSTKFTYLPSPETYSSMPTTQCHNLA